MCALAVRFSNVSFHYRQRPALRDIDLEIPAGGFVGLVGRGQFELWGGYVRPEVHLGYSYEFAGQPGDANVYFVSAQNMRFKISGPAEPVSRLIGGGSLHFVYNNWSAGADYDRTFGSTTSEAASLSVTGHF